VATWGKKGKGIRRLTQIKKWERAGEDIFSRGGAERRREEDLRIRRGGVGIRLRSGCGGTGIRRFRTGTNPEERRRQGGRSGWRDGPRIKRLLFHAVAGHLVEADEVAVFAHLTDGEFAVDGDGGVHNGLHAVREFDADPFVDLGHGAVTTHGLVAHEEEFVHEPGFDFEREHEAFQRNRFLVQGADVVGDLVGRGG